MTVTLDARVDELVAATALGARVREIAELLSEARARILAAEQLAERLPAADSIRLDLNRELVTEAFDTMRWRVDHSILTLDLEPIHALEAALDDLASDLRQYLYDGLAGDAHA